MKGPGDSLPHRRGAIPRRVKRGLSLLLTAYDYAVDLQRDRWEFATEMAALEHLGLTRNDFRWLVGKGIVQHAVEITVPGAASRQFQPQPELIFTATTCFVLTDKGLIETRSLRPHVHEAKLSATGQAGEGPSVAPQPSNKSSSTPEQLAPRWDASRHELRLGPHLIKAFKLPSPNQETILTVFEEEGWPSRIDDPLPPHPDMMPKQRLHDTIKSLNRNQRQRLVRFVGDGTGLGVCWERIPNGNGSLHEAEWLEPSAPR
jgi:hypothetical protein